MKVGLMDHQPLSREDYERMEIASTAATELDDLRLGQLGQIDQGVIRLVEWLEQNFSRPTLVTPHQLLVVREALCKQGLFDEKERATAALLEAIAHAQIILRGIIIAPLSARRSIPTIEKMRDFCLAIARVSGRFDF